MEVTAEPVELLAKITLSAFEIGTGGIGIEAEVARSARRVLLQPARAGWRNRTVPPTVLLPD